MPQSAETDPADPATPVALTIAGFDPSSGAGITADLQVFAAHGIFGTSAITALTVQSTRGVASTHPVDPQVLRDTLSHLTADLPPAGIKIGMLGNLATVQEVTGFLDKLLREKGSNQHIPIVLDPVILSSSGKRLLDEPGLGALNETLLKYVGWITPNWQELGALTGLTVTSEAEAGTAADALAERHPHLSIIATGGDQTTPVDVLRLASGERHTFLGKRIETTSTHGTGCAFSSALLSRLILGEAPFAAVAAAKQYVEGALRHAPGLGSGRGPMNLLWKK